MAKDNWSVAKVKGVEPEQFFIFIIDTEVPKGPFMRTSNFFSEAELRAELKAQSSTDAEIDSLIEQARATPA